jgi:hypothetical protein
MATTPPTKQSLLQEINLLTERFTGFMESSSHSDVIEKLDSCKQQLNSLTTEIDSITDESLDESRAQLSAADIQIKQMKQYLRPEFLCGIPDEEWNGCAPPSLVMTDIPNEVRQGQGGWDKSDFLFEIRGKSYLYDNVKVSLLSLSLSLSLTTPLSPADRFSDSAFQSSRCAVGSTSLSSPTHHQRALVCLPQRR